MNPDQQTNKTTQPVVQSTKVALPPNVAGNWGNTGASAKDLVIPRLVLCQGLTQAVKDEKAKQGDMINGLTAELLAKKGEVIEVLPIMCIPWWFFHTLPAKGKSQGKFIRKEMLTDATESDNWKQETFDADKQPIVKTKMLSFLVLPVKRVSGFPFFVDFQRTGKMAGKTLSTIMQENAYVNRPPCARVVSLGSAVREFDNNSWFTFTVTPGRDASVEELTACRRWFDILSDKAAQAATAPDEDNGIA